MSAVSATFSPNACVLGSVNVGIHGMIDDGIDRNPTIALKLQSEAVCGLSAGFHASTNEMRAFAAELIRHCDITDDLAGAPPLEAAITRNEVRP